LSAPPAAEHVYGLPPLELAGDVSQLTQYSPLVPGAQRLEDVPRQTLGNMIMLAPPGTIERRYVLALALRALKPDATLTALAPKDKGGSRLAGDMDALGCTFHESSKRHHRICVTQGGGEAQKIAQAMAEGAPRFDEDLGLWTQPGVFSWNRIDLGSALLMDHLPDLKGRGADLGAGLGLLAHSVLRSDAVTSLTLVELDGRAVDCAKRNVTDPRATVLHADVRKLNDASLKGLDFIVMNPPFHEGGAEDKALGQAFLKTAASLLHKGGMLYAVANRHLPYEATLKEHFRRVALIAEGDGFKVFEAQA
jgi:16S rRNA (guanine1207-N2)-methyltransferase